MTLVSGGQDVFPATATFVPTASGACMLHATAYIIGSSSGTASVHPVLKIDGGAPAYNGANTGSHPGTNPIPTAAAYSNWHFDVTAGTTYQLGCHVEASGSFVGAELKCYVDWMCHPT